MGRISTPLKGNQPSIFHNLDQMKTRFQLFLCKEHVYVKTYLRRTPGFESYADRCDSMNGQQKYILHLKEIGLRVQKHVSHHGGISQ